MIESYSFGSMLVDGKLYSADLIIGPGRVQTRWWRKSGHCLCMEDLETVLYWGMEFLVIGTGANGMMAVPENLLLDLKSRGIVAEPLRTGEAWMRFNALLKQDKRVAGAFHLTC